ncbi:hypothetical protein ANN_11573 [Periplaneta americana]|uniref:Uncharacterized protein n=1 Tax=Periplaneta americana TaxID=6978 RepID=A0ABQ8T5E1_PERAM|nr:hypothetical protein ANN_11573 [Periplaneta americana]
MDLREVGYDDRDWINLAQDREQWRVYVRSGNEPLGSLKAIFNVDQVGVVGIALAFYARERGFDPGLGRWYLSVLKCDGLMSVDLLAYKRTPAGQNSGTPTIVT